MGAKTNMVVVKTDFEKSMHDQHWAVNNGCKNK